MRVISILNHQVDMYCAAFCFTFCCCAPHSRSRVVSMASSGDPRDRHSKRSRSTSEPRPFKKMPRMSTEGPPIACISKPLFLTNYVYSYSELWNTFEYVCPDCGARFLLVPSSDAAREFHGIQEVCLHKGNQHGWNRPGKCTCTVEWHPVHWHGFLSEPRKPAFHQ